MATREDCAYAAGIIDGEGCILIAKRNRNPENYELHVRVGTVDEIICPWFHKTFGGSLCRSNSGTQKGFSPKLIWSMSSASAENFLRMVLPWLKYKRAQAELAFEFRATHKRPGIRLSDEERAIQHAFYEEMKDEKARNILG